MSPPPTPGVPGQPGDWPDPYAPSASSEPATTPAAAPGPPAYPHAAYGPPPAAPPGYGYAPYGYAYPAQPPTNGLAIASLVCSLAGLAVGLSAPVGAILGHVARRQIRERGEQGDGMALAGIIVGWILTGVMLLCCVGYLAVFGWALTQEAGSV